MNKDTFSKSDPVILVSPSPRPGQSQKPATGPLVMLPLASCDGARCARCNQVHAKMPNGQYREVWRSEKIMNKSRPEATRGASGYTPRSAPSCQPQPSAASTDGDPARKQPKPGVQDQVRDGLPL